MVGTHNHQLSVSLGRCLPWLLSLLAVKLCVTHLG